MSLTQPQFTNCSYSRVSFSASLRVPILDRSPKQKSACSARTKKFPTETFWYEGALQDTPLCYDIRNLESHEDCLPERFNFVELLNRSGAKLPVSTEDSALADRQESSAHSVAEAGSLCGGSLTW